MSDEFDPERAEAAWAAVTPELLREIGEDMPHELVDEDCWCNPEVIEVEADHG